MKTQELNLLTIIKKKFSEEDANAFMGSFDEIVTEKVTEALKNKTENLIHRKEMSDFVIEIKTALNNLDNKINNLESNLDNKINNLEGNLDNKINNLESNLNNKINNLESKIDLKIEKASNKNLWVIITIGIVQIITLLIAIYLK